MSHTERPAVSIQKVAGVLKKANYTQVKRVCLYETGFNVCEAAEWVPADQPDTTKRVPFIMVRHHWRLRNQDTTPTEDVLATYVQALRAAGLDAKLVPWKRDRPDRNGCPSTNGIDPYVAVSGLLDAPDTDAGLNAGLNGPAVEAARREQSLRGFCQECREEYSFGTVGDVVKCCKCGTVVAHVLVGGASRACDKMPA